ncbi:MAG: Holliday junction resolvase RuvX, partial [Dehalococcoidia bacterium]|nr:Holliday junction resolvase RuvX [Dehalococcoidia bacterium]
VAGLPRSMDDSLGPQAQKVQAFVDGLSEVSPVPVETWDERLSTVAADLVMIESGTKRDKKKQHRDAIAASFILQGYLDQQRSTRREEGEP